MTKSFQIFMTMVVFCASCTIGLCIARQKPLWIDEIFSERFDVSSLSYSDIITGKKGDDEKSPVYFGLQKFIEQILGYQFPAGVDSGHLFVDRKAQLICRINPVFWMSLAMTMIFYYFMATSGLWAGLSALLMILSTYMVWGYWAEDRIYPFWFFATSLQSLTVLWASQYGLKNPPVPGLVILANMFLCLTTPLSALQIAAVSVWLYWAGYRKMADFIWIAVIPILICFYYYSRNYHYAAFFINVPMACGLVTANIPPERMAFVLAAFLYWRQKLLKPLSASEGNGDLSYLCYVGLVLAAAGGILLLFLMKTGTTLRDFHFNGRHFIFLAPVGCIVSAFVFVRMMQTNSLKGIRIALILLLALLTIPRIWKYIHFSYATGEPKYSAALLI